MNNCTNWLYDLSQPIVKICLFQTNIIVYQLKFPNINKGEINFYLQNKLNFTQTPVAYCELNVFFQLKKVYLNFHLLYKNDK